MRTLQASVAFIDEDVALQAEQRPCCREIQSLQERSDPSIGSLIHPSCPTLLIL